MKRKRFEPHDLGHPAPPGLNERVEEGTRVAWDLVLKRWQGENIWITSGSKGRLCQYHFNHHCPPHPHPCPLTHCQEQELAGEAPSALLYHQHCHHDHQDEWQPGGNGAGVGWRSISSTRQHIRQDLSDSILSPDHVNHDGDIVEDMITIHDLTWMVANREYIHDCNWLKPALFWPRPRCNMHIPSPNIHQECKKNRWPLAFGEKLPKNRSFWKRKNYFLCHLDIWKQERKLLLHSTWKRTAFAPNVFTPRYIYT